MSFARDKKHKLYGLLMERGIARDATPDSKLPRVCSRIFLVLFTQTDLITQNIFYQCMNFLRFLFKNENCFKNCSTTFHEMRKFIAVPRLQ